MAKLRRNHQQKDKSGFASLLVRVFMFLGLLVFGFFYLYRILNSNQSSENQVTILPKQSSNTVNYLPKNCTGEYVQHDYYSLCYNENWEQSEWVAYQLTAASLRAKNVPRTNNFIPDPQVSTKSAKHGDYSHSGYTRGHMAPAGDMAFDTRAMKESFYMSNMSPQLKECNGGIWRELEENVRDWAIQRGSIYVVSGPIISPHFKTIGNHTKIAIPDSFYKVLLDTDRKEGIAYIIPNTISEDKLESYAVSIDEVEKLTGLDFFADLLSDNEENIESKFNNNTWKTDNGRYEQRVKSWNKR